MKVIRYFAWLVVLTMSSCCSDPDPVGDGCIDPSKKTDGACYEIFAPVCGCDGVTYANDCFAEAAGLKSWTEGACK
jgi:hypothetical protein